MTGKRSGTAEKFHGRVCERCGGTERYRSSRSCVVCVKAKAAERLKRKQAEVAA